MQLHNPTARIDFLDTIDSDRIIIIHLSKFLRCVHLETGIKRYRSWCV